MKNPAFKIFLIAIAFLLIVSFGLEIHYMSHEEVALSTRLTLLLLLNMTFLALLILMFFVAKSLVKLHFERKHKIPGYKFKTKLVATLVILTLIPSSFLFILSSGLITNYIDRWFSPQIKIPLDSSIEIAKAVYENEKQEALTFAKAPVSGKTVKGYRVKYLSKIPVDASETIRAAFEGKEGTEVVSGGKGDLIRAVVPEYKGGTLTRIILVETVVPVDITKNVEKIKEAYENYMALESWKVPIKANYLLILGFMTFIVVFMALWVGLRIARGITDPIQKLALATQQVAAGDLNTKVDIGREDEIGLLVDSFNDMVKKLKSGNESLQSAYLYIKNILNNINSGVIMLDTSGEISVINGAACTILNIKPEEIVYQSYRELMSRIDSQELQRVVSGIEGRAFKPVKKQITAMIGDRRVILLVFITSLKDAEKYIGLLVVFDDLTDVIEAQKALTWQDVARKIAHEIKNPLTPIKLSTERMMKKWEHRDGDFDQAFRQSTQMIIKEVDSLKKLVDAFSKFGKMPEIKKTPISLPALIHEVVNLYKGYKKIEIRVAVPNNPPLADLDAEQFKRVMINIFDNAIQAMMHNGQIDVTLSFDLASNSAQIEIADHGPGIKHEDREKLFHPYFSTKKDGTGLGLAIAQRIIKEHKGKIRVRDNIPAGTVFTIRIPIKET
jgi:two-component system, NtrC family, nitrogen regulation sensor histidine kinase NtrY